MYKYSKSIGLSYETQGYIFFRCLLYKNLSEDDQRQIRECIMAAVGKEHYGEIFDLVTGRKTYTAICIEYYIAAESTLYRLRKRFYELYAKCLGLK